MYTGWLAAILYLVFTVAYVVTYFVSIDTLLNNNVIFSFPLLSILYAGKLMCIMLGNHS